MQRINRIVGQNCFISFKRNGCIWYIFLPCFTKWTIFVISRLLYRLSFCRKRADSLRGEFSPREQVLPFNIGVHLYIIYIACMHGLGAKHFRSFLQVLNFNLKCISKWGTFYLNETIFFFSAYGCFSMFCASLQHFMVMSY